MEAQSFKVMIEAVASDLKGWEFEQMNHEHAGTIKHVDTGAQILFFMDWKGKCEVSGRFPNDEDGRVMSGQDWGLWPYNEKCPVRIRMNPEKEVKKIVRDVEKKIIPQYLELYAKAAGKKQARQVMKQKRQNLINELCSHHGNMEQSKEFEFKAWNKGTEGPQVTMTVSSGLEVEIKVHSLPEGKAKQILEILR